MTYTGGKSQAGTFLSSPPLPKEEGWGEGAIDDHPHSRQ
jgi:hypothetical protein